VTLNRPAASILSVDVGVTVLQLTPKIILLVNVNGSHGKTFQASFQLGVPIINLIAPTTNTVYLNSTNQTLLLSATASNPTPANAMTTVWSQTDGPGDVTFGDPNALITTANFSAGGTYGIAFTANNGLTTSTNLTVVVITRPKLSFQLLPGAVQLSWPSDVGRWQLQFQTNPPATGLGTNWQNLSGVVSNPFVAPIDSVAGSAFYRLLLINN
jgi:hypothetical protein